MVLFSCVVIALLVIHSCSGTNWDVVVKTCALDGSGTDAKTYLKIYYEYDHAQQTIFLNDPHNNVFEKGQRDQFEVGLNQNDVINVGLYYMPSATFGEAWCVDWLILANRNLDKCYVALFDKWISHYADPPTYPKLFHQMNFQRCVGAYGI